MHTTDSQHTMPVSPNVLARQFEQPCLNRVWVCDITYIRTRSGWLYLATVLDMHPRKILCYAMAPEMLFQRKKPLAGCQQTALDGVMVELGSIE